MVNPGKIRGRVADLAKWGLHFSLLALVAVSVAAASDRGHDEAAIRTMMRQTWERAEAPLVIAPLVIAEEFAVAGWTQDGRGGRALLRKNRGGWAVILCGGDGLREAEAFKAAGASPRVAERLAADLTEAEAKMPPAERAKLSLFGGIVEIQASAPHGSGHDHSDNAR